MEIKNPRLLVSGVFCFVGLWLKPLIIMKIPNLNVETEFDIMANYQTAVESKSIIIENSPKDRFRYSLIQIIEPIPTYKEYLNGNDFDEQDIIMQANNIDQLINQQNIRRNLY